MSVLLGLCDGALDPKRHRSTFRTNKAGGLPDWPPPVRGPCPRCRRCGAASALVVQVYCPVDLTPTHRSLHLFACTASACSGLSDAWTALRSQGPAEEPPGPDPPAGPGPRATDWCDGADDWGEEEEEEQEEVGGVEKEAPSHQEEQEEVLEEPAWRPAVGELDVNGRLQDLHLQDPHLQDPHLQDLHLQDPHLQDPHLQDLHLQDPHLQDLHLQDLHLQDPHLQEAAVFSPLFISVVEEAELYEEDDALWRARQLLREYESREGAVAEAELGGGDDGGGGSQEKYEKAEARHGDQVFGDFMKQISPCPRQILRYRRGGWPLFVSSPPRDASRLAAPCGACGAARTFELQLMPALVSLLRGPRAPLEFGTVLVYTCSRSCWAPGSNSPREEFCFVQTDPDQQLFN